MTDTTSARHDEQALAERVQQLETALQTRVVIEQAKGIIVGRHAVDIAEAFEALRASARASRQRLHDLAQRVVDEPETPEEVLRRLPGGRRDD